MNIPSLSSISFLGKVSDKFEKAIQVKPTPPDTFERSKAVEVPKKAPSDAEVKYAKDKMEGVKYDHKSIELALKEGVDIDKISVLAKGMSNDKTTKVILRNCPFDKENNYIVKAFNGKDESTLKLVDKKLNVLAQEDSVTKFSPLKDNPIKKTTKSMDFRTNTFSEIIYNVNEKFGPVVNKETKIKRDKQGRLIRKETSTASDVPGMYNVKYEFPNGKTRDLSKISVDKKTGITTIVKDMRSTDMTRTQYRYEDDPQGNRIMDYKITSTDGKVLMKQSQSFEKIGENKYRSTRNDKVFDVELTKTSINVLDVDKNEETQIPLEGFIKGNEAKVLNMLKNVPGDELMNMANSVVNIEEIPDRMDSYCQTQIYETGEPNEYITAGTLAISDDPFVFLHELGHATDMDGKDVELIMDEKGEAIDMKIKDVLNTDEQFVKTYNEERKNYLKEFPPTQRNYVDYFIEEEAVEGQADRGRKETIAETNAMLNAYQSVDILGMRTQYLQQHFPKTIAYLSTKLTQDKL